MITIQLRATSDYEHGAYGIMYRSETLHRVTGQGVYNRHFDHEVTVWDNRRNPNGEGFISPDGKVTADAISVILSARASVITARSAGDNVTSRRGETLAIGDTVTLLHPQRAVYDRFVIQARTMADPIMTIAS